MELVVALISMAIVVIVAAYVAQPLLVKIRVKASADDSPRQKLLAERDTIYAAIRDLDFDFQTGKLLDVDYRVMRDKYTARGVETLKKLDTLSKEPDPADRKPHEAPGDEIEAAVQARRKVKSQSAGRKDQEDDIEAAIRARRQMPDRNQKSEVNHQACPKCGQPIDSSDRFCAKCGTALTLEATR